ncbi:MAG: flavodoxin family protein [Desulfuromonadales bacterium]|nr:flavodoxin family protein [Desulfuromonadales bacterium]
MNESSGKNSKVKVIAINGSPRKEWNTATLLKKALEGAASTGAETELVNLYDLNYKGCTSCFACKIRGGESYGKCGYKDELIPILERIAKSDALIVGSPIYLGAVTGETRSFSERLLFQYLTYTVPYHSLAPKKLKTALIYTMGQPEEQSRERGYSYIFDSDKRYFSLIFGGAETFCCYDTYQFKDYSKFVAECFDVEHKKERHDNIFPKECQQAYELGVKMIQ